MVLQISPQKHIQSKRMSMRPITRCRLATSDKMFARNFNMWRQSVQEKADLMFSTNFRNDNWLKMTAKSCPLIPLTPPVDKTI
jgi:ribosomal protein S14